MNRRPEGCCDHPVVKHVLAIVEKAPIPSEVPLCDIWL